MQAQGSRGGGGGARRSAPAAGRPSGASRCRTSTGACSTASCCATRARWASSAPSRWSPATSAARPTRMPLHVEILYNEYQLAAAFAVASLLALLALATLAAKSAARVALRAMARGGGAQELRMSIEVRDVSRNASATSRRCSDVSLEVRAGRAGRAARAVGLGQDDAAAHHRRASTSRPRRGAASTARTPRDAGARERRVGFVFQHYALFRHMTVFENVAFGLRVRPRAARPTEGRDRASASTSCSQLVQLDGLADRATRRSSPAASASASRSPARWRSSRACCCSTSRSARSTRSVRKELRRWLRQLHDEHPHHHVFVTHDQEEALEVADRVVVMNHGRIEQVGTPRRGVSIGRPARSSTSSSAT